MQANIETTNRKQIWKGLPMNGLHPLRKPSFEAFRQKNNPWNLGLGLQCSTRCLIVTMHLLPGLLSITACK
jgi:hypothetical protein